MDFHSNLIVVLTILIVVPSLAAPPAPPALSREDLPSSPPALPPASPPRHASRRVVAHAVGDDVTFSCKSSSPLPVLWRRKDQHKILAIGDAAFDDSIDRYEGMDWLTSSDVLVFVH